MQKLQRVFSLLILPLCLSLTLCVHAGKGVDKEKTYSKSYPLSAGDMVSIHNEFGKVNVKTWDKNEVRVDVTITITASDDADADYMLNHIQIEDGKEGGEVHFKTHMDLNGHWKSTTKNEKFNIDYEVSIPSAQALTLTNNFGATTIPDYNGLLDLTSKFGSLEAGHLASVKALNVEFGKATVASVHDGKISIKFSPAEISDLSGDIDANFEFCNSMNLRATAGLKSLQIKNSYTELNLRLATGIPVNFDISTHFGSVNNHSDYSLQDDPGNNKELSFKKSYTGKSGDGSVNIRVKGEFSNISLN